MPVTFYDVATPSQNCSEPYSRLHSLQYIDIKVQGYLACYTIPYREVLMSYSDLQETRQN